MVRLPLVVAGVALVLSGCTETVFKERELFEAPPDQTFNFLGYSDESTKLTVCGNCHVGKQAGWETTGHAEAWEALQASGSAREVCEGCHSVNERGNALTEAAGYNLVEDSRYHDVQCESCHGPGLEHVENPDASQPLASVLVGVGLGNGCGDCHEGAHHPFVDQWAESRHGTVPNQGGPLSVGEYCLPCHEGRTALEVRFGEVDDYIEKDNGEPLPIVCVVCHDPHGSPYENNLRAPIDVASTDHLCVTCHSRTGSPGTSVRRGPHAAQGLLVLGENAGWEPPNFQYDEERIIGTHGTEANPKLCATCHVNIFTVTDAESGDFVFAAKGHTFEAIPCVDEQGVPVAGPCELTSKDFGACATSGCHGSTTAARSALSVVENRINNLLDQLWDDVDGDREIDATDGGLLPQLVARNDVLALSVSDQTLTVAEGALWNAMLAHTDQRPHWGGGEVFGSSFSAHLSSGRGAHNPFLVEALLTASIDAVIDEYELVPPIGLDLTVHATPPPMN